MSIFDRMDRVTSRVVDRTHAVAFELQPVLKTPNGRPITDAYRSLWFGKGIFEENPQDVPVEIGRRDRAGNNIQTLVTGQRFELSVDRRSYVEASAIKQGDRILMTDSRSFEVVEIKPDGLSRIVFGLIELLQ
ncbi:hypothetical protein KHQ08_09355 [Pseudochrobactrum algeriensis]|uniref:hypothetical protein n=1 Tax=Pseudochrobactrum algeriensis TaxID=2834768 RepID=UPI001BCB43BB|nr:hypothetical protein [Pseudochrobactrum algeriensis]QVQ38162.1 hypothetical protein KHQ08_09355 [Pseudochrobactrum algeriensis]QVQ41388.1 hypothetical protein KHQ07_07660 [Pseudochrobactrum algeriensis]QVQ45310.1 hypothetical protein KHQ09_09615 [Pseudochrobactrum algeriensis]